MGIACGIKRMQIARKKARHFATVHPSRGTCSPLGQASLMPGRTASTFGSHAKAFQNSVAPRAVTNTGENTAFVNGLLPSRNAWEFYLCTTIPSESSNCSNTLESAEVIISKAYHFPNIFKCYTRCLGLHGSKK